jgi:hypothetical protein
VEGLDASPEALDVLLDGADPPWPAPHAGSQRATTATINSGASRGTSKVLPIRGLQPRLHPQANYAYVRC